MLLTGAFLPSSGVEPASSQAQEEWWETTRVALELPVGVVLGIPAEQQDAFGLGAGLRISLEAPRRFYAAASAIVLLGGAETRYEPQRNIYAGVEGGFSFPVSASPVVTVRPYVGLGGMANIAHCFESYGCGAGKRPRSEGITLWPGVALVRQAGVVSVGMELRLILPLVDNSRSTDEFRQFGAGVYAFVGLGSTLSPQGTR